MADLDLRSDPPGRVEDRLLLLSVGWGAAAAEGALMVVEGTMARVRWAAGIWMGLSA